MSGYSPQGTLTLSAQTKHLVAGQPLLADFCVKNSSQDRHIIYDSSEFILPIVTDPLAEAIEPGGYSVVIAFPSLGVASQEVTVLVNPYGAASLEIWASETADALLEVPDGKDVFELSKTLTSVRGDLARPSLAQAAHYAVLRTAGG